MFAGASPPLTDRIPIPPASTFNINLSSADEATMLGLLGVPGRKTEKEKSFSTSVDVLEALASSHPLPATVLEYRSLSKLLSTYVESLPALVNPETGRVHASFNQTAAATGRHNSAKAPWAGPALSRTK
jgi:DNA polymerase-1